MANFIERMNLAKQAIELGIFFTLKDDIKNAPDEKTREALVNFRDNELVKYGQTEEDVYRVVRESKLNKETVSYVNLDTLAETLKENGGYDFILKEVNERLNQKCLTEEEALKIYDYMQDMDWMDYEKEQDIAFLRELTKENSIEELNSDMLPEEIETIGDLLEYIDKEKGEER